MNQLWQAGDTENFKHQITLIVITVISCYGYGCRNEVDGLILCRRPTKLCDALVTIVTISHSVRTEVGPCVNKPTGPKSTSGVPWAPWVLTAGVPGPNQGSGARGSGPPWGPCRSMTPIFNNKCEYSSLHFWCKSVDGSLNPLQVVIWTSLFS